MKSDIHPTYYPEAIATCACGVSRVVGSSMESIEVEICSSCHPFFTGEQKIVDTAGRVDKFKKKTEVAKTLAPKKKKVIKKRTQASDTQKAAVKKGKTQAPKTAKKEEAVKEEA
ncbi:MAG: 50S ribosomal protein L31 [Candidatus Vogelbacteria bacterium CG10_big_fil_rev_8_21_14_0_10_45_14]|uniref:Large ribosomal subunit protein bL31 n=1 Tax=Candidatus Vogelbacteria bacterium CG10_big_fil_rev_8_21_14_0_10_45_14 TaxID=1975042 RepID=A0A2H0RKW2_9BACT|nr:MAG: 50S ribosomal protein L31 [Candidatus Vogelbacteria bacterium CG10_big_fil_rev_8_21_14_0_10_45_14]